MTMKSPRAFTSPKIKGEHRYSERRFHCTVTYKNMENRWWNSELVGLHSLLRR